MSKLWGLYVNEMYKLFKKPIVIVLMALIILSGLLFPALIKIASSLNSEPNREDKNTIETQLQYFEDEKTRISVELEDAIENEGDEYFIEDLKIQLDELDRSIFSSEVSLELELYNEPKHVIYDSFFSEAFSSLLSQKDEIVQLNKVPDDERDATWAVELEQAENGYAQLMAAMKNKDFIAFNKYQLNALLIYESFFSSSDAEIRRSSLELLPVLDPTGGINGEINFQYSRLIADHAGLLKYELDNNIQIKTDPMTWTQNVVILSEEMRVEKQQEYDILMYKIENNQIADSLPDSDSGIGRGISVEFSNFFVSILIFFAAGSIVATEMSTGSIKALIIAPVRRWKIFTAKFLTLLTLFLAAIFFLCVATNIGNSIFLGLKGASYLFISGGKVISIPYIFFDYVFLLADHTLLFVLMLFAFMLSTVSRHSAVGIAVPFALMMITSWATMILSILPIAKKRWMDFLYFYNTDLADRLFPMQKFFDLVTYINNSQYMSQSNLPSLTFSILFVLILSACLFYVGFDSFTRRDIK